MRCCPGFFCRTLKFVINFNDMNFDNMRYRTCCIAQQPNHMVHARDEIALAKAPALAYKPRALPEIRI